MGNLNCPWQQSNVEDIQVSIYILNEAFEQHEMVVARNSGPFQTHGGRRVLAGVFWVTISWRPLILISDHQCF
jgi:hypothetical protein